MDIFVTTDVNHKECTCQSWSIQIADMSVTMGLECPVHACGAWSQFNGYIMDVLLLTSISNIKSPSRQYCKSLHFRPKEFFVIYIPVAGNILLEQEEGSQTISPGEIGIFHSEGAQSAGMSSDFYGIVLVIPFDSLQAGLTLTEESTGNCVLDAATGPAQLVVQMASSLPSVLECEGSMSRRRELAQHLTGLLRMALRTELELNSNVTARQHVHLDKIFKVIDSGLDDPDLDLESIAEKVFLSPSYVCRLLNVHGSSLREEIRSRRLKQVAAALANPSRQKTSVTLLALESGFCNSSAFSRVFCQKYGVSPREYRKMHMKPVQVATKTIHV